MVLIVAGWMAAGPASYAADPDVREPYNTQDTEGNPLTDAEQSLRSIALPEGFNATLFASEPQVQQPIAIAFDARGRLWVAENYTYAEGALNFDTSLSDRIVILEDSDGDGRADKRTVFWDRAEKLTSIEIGHGGVWALCAPNLLFIPDADGDDRPDGEPIVMLDGWNAHEVRHNIVNGLRWGPDGWLYGRHGILATSLIGPPGTPDSLRTPINCGVWRFHPTRHVFEAVAHGTTNPWGADWDEYGQMFFINTVIGHLWHVLPGAHYERMYGEHLRGNLYRLMTQTADHVHWDTREKWSDIREGVSSTTDAAGGGHAHSGLMIYQGDNWPEELRGNVFTINLHGRRLNRDILKRHGAAYTATHAPDMFQFGDPWFRGIDLLYGPDGSVYVADWTDIGECHENDGVHRTSGRIFRLVWGEAKPFHGDLSKLESAELAELQLHSNDWFPRMARRLLGERAAAGKDVAAARDRLFDIFENHPEVTRKLRALWALHAIGAIDNEWLRGQLDHEEEHVRVWAVTLLADGPLDSVTRDALVRRASEESSGLVLLWLASALQRLEPADRWTLAAPLLEKASWADDPAYPCLVWYGVEPAVLADPERAVQAAVTSQLPMLREHIARRLTQELASQPQAVATLVEHLPQLDVSAQTDVLRGMALALRGWRKATPPTSWKSVAERLANSEVGEIRDLVREISLVFGDGRAARELIAMLESDSTDLDTRRSAIRALVESRNEEVVPLLQALLGNRDLASDAVRGLAAYRSDATPEMLVERYYALPGEARAEVITALVSRPEFALALMKAVAADKIPRTDVSAFQIRQMRGYNVPDLAAELDRLWPELRDITTAKARRIEEVRDKLTPEVLASADRIAGRRTFDRVCASCHTLFGNGGKAGPDLTGGQRTNLQYLLENIIDPSAQVAENFRMSILTLVDGRVLNGVVTERTARTLTVHTPTEQMVVALDDIEEIQASQLSMMPDQLLDALTSEQVAELIAYLMSPTQVELPE